MDSSTNIQELKDKVKKFCDDRDWDKFHDAKELAVGLVLEASEVLEPFRFMDKNQINDYMREHKSKVSEEIADVLYYVLRIAQFYDIDISESFEKKMGKNEKNYPADKSRGQNKKYDYYV